MIPKVLWLIGGSDCAGYAGIQADQRTAQDIGVSARTIVTAITAQNLTQVSAVEAVSADLLRQQIDTLSAQESPDVIKIGLLVNEVQVHLLADWLKSMSETSKPFVILDPVISASAGNPLQQAGLTETIDRLLLPLVDLLTPNLNEWQRFLVVRGLPEGASPESDFRKWRRDGDPELYLKGGHAQGDQVTDYWITQGACNRFCASRQPVTARGTGCTLASALGSYLALDFVLEDALTLAFSYLQAALRCAELQSDRLSRLGLPGAWPTLADLPKLDQADDLGLLFAKIDETSLGLYPVVESLEWVERLISWGVTTLQLRIKEGLDDASRREIREAIALAAQRNVKLFINDHWAYAIEQGAYGVHLGQEDLQVADLNAIANAGLRLGVSTHGFFEIARAIQLSPSYIALGHIFETQTKEMPSNPQGLERLSRYQSLLNGCFPTVAIGGITEARVAAVLDTGVSAVALVSAITKAEDPQAATERLLWMMAEGRAGEIAA